MFAPARLPVYRCIFTYYHLYMITSLKRVFALSFIVLVTGCGQQSDQEMPATAAGKPVQKGLPDSILGERVKGPVEVRDKPGGEVLFTLADSTLVSCAEEQGGWSAVGLYMQIPLDEYGTDTIRKGRKIVLGGKEVGEVLKDTYVTTSSTGRESWAELTGYVPKDRVYPFAVIEQALAGYMDTVKGRTAEHLEPFIRSFAMEKDEELKPYVSYFTYESWIEDPSPLPRVQLVFHENRLIGVIHSRHLELPHTTEQKLERGFRVLFFDDTPTEVKENFTKQFNRFITSVD